MIKAKVHVKIDNMDAGLFYIKIGNNENILFDIGFICSLKDEWIFQTLLRNIIILFIAL